MKSCYTFHLPQIQYIQGNESTIYIQHSNKWSYQKKGIHNVVILYVMFQFSFATACSSEILLICSLLKLIIKCIVCTLSIPNPQHFMFKVGEKQQCLCYFSLQK
jgi:hypothetical protein